MKVLVSGAGGFLGRFVVQRLLERGHSVRAIVRPSFSSSCGRAMSKSFEPTFGLAVFYPRLLMVWRP